MSTIAQSGLKSAAHVNSHEKSVAMTDFWNKVEAIRFGIIPLLFLLIPCLAGIAASTALFSNNMVLFTIAGAPAMAVETLILGMASMRSIVITSAVSCIVSIAVMFIA